MTEMSVAVSNKVVARNGIGRFIEQIKMGEEMTMRDLAEKGADLSRSFAPKGTKPDPRTPRIVDSIHYEYSPTSARWFCNARHGLPQETGAKDHEITGQVSFFWEKRGRPFRPGPNMIHHPGNPARPFLRPAYEIIMRTWMDYARRHLPR